VREIFWLITVTRNQITSTAVSHYDR